MGRVVKFSVVDGSGKGMPAQKVHVGSDELATGAAGMAQVLLEDGPTVIKVNGVVVYEGPADALKPIETFRATGERVR